MEPAGWITLGVIALILLTLILTRIGPDVILLGGLTMLMVLPTPVDGAWRMGVIGPADGLAGLSNPGPVTVACPQTPHRDDRPAGSVESPL